MDKETLSNYGWIVICVLVLAVMLALATPFGTFIADGFKATYTGLFETGDSALDVGLNAVGVSNKLPCGHGRKESGDHSQKECGHYACDDSCTCVPASCGVDGHWSGDGKDHSVATSCNEHDYVCQCDGWIVPEGGIYTTYDRTNMCDVIYTDGEMLPCDNVANVGDKFTLGDYQYTCEASNGWRVELNTAVTDKNQTSYDPILETINGIPITNLNYLFEGCSNLTVAPRIPTETIYMYCTFNGCTSLTTPPPVIPANVANLINTFTNCSNLSGVIEINTTKISYLLAPDRKRHFEPDRNDQFEPRENRQQPRLVI